MPRTLKDEASFLDFRLKTFSDYMPNRSSVEKYLKHQSIEDLRCAGKSYSLFIYFLKFYPEFRSLGGIQFHCAPELIFNDTDDQLHA